MSNPLNPTDRERRKELAKKSLYAFCKIYLSHMMTHPSGEFHKKLCKNLELALRPGGRVAGLISRGHAKTTYGTYGVALREICLNRGKDNILLIAANDEEMKGKLDAIKGELDDNDLLKYDYGEGIKAKKRSTGISVKDSQSELQCENGVRIAGRVILGKVRGRNIRGKRIKLIIIDDPEDDKNVKHRRWRDDVEDWVNNTLLNTLDPYNDSVVWLGTLTHYDSPLHRAMETKKDWITFQDDCATEWPPTKDTVFLWPEYWTIEKLKKKEKDITGTKGRRAFLQEYMNIPIDPEGQMYRRDMWKYYGTERLHEVGRSYWIAPIDAPSNWQMGHKLDVYISCDPALGTERKHDYTAFFVIGTFGKNRDIYVLDVVNIKVKPNQLIEKYVALQRKWNPRRCGMEDFGFQAFLKQKVVEAGMNVIGIRSSASKDERIDSAATPFDQGRVYLPRGHDTVKRFTAQAEAYPNDRHDDMVDAWAQVLELTQATGGGGVVACKRKRRMNSSDSGALSGY